MATRSVARSVESTAHPAVGPSGWYPAVKRAFDVALAGVGLLASLPLWILIAAAIVIEDGRPVFFSREVGGRGGHPFRVFKFRTMKKGDQPIADVDPRHDVRLTRVGRILRPTAFDELPSLWHIVKGEMSFVGPRTLLLRVEDPADPDRGKATAALPRAAIRNSVRPGLTGLAQIYAIKNRAYRQKFRYDALYVRKMSFGLDMKLLAGAFMRTLRRRWQ